MGAEEVLEETSQGKNERRFGNIGEADGPGLSEAPIERCAWQARESFGRVSVHPGDIRHARRPASMPGRRYANTGVDPMADSKQMPVGMDWTGAVLPGGALLGAMLLLAWWWSHVEVREVKMRLPDPDRATTGGSSARRDPAANGVVVAGTGAPLDFPGSWPQFRGPQRDGVSPETTGLARGWKDGGPRELWGVECGEGYAGPVVRAGRVYLMDYVAARKMSALRCLSLADGKEIWRYEYPTPLKRNHGVTRTVPTIADSRIVAMDSVCNVICLDATSGRLQWSINLVREYGATVPPWYAGQCPLVVGRQVILAPGGPAALLMAVDLDTGKVLWKSPNPREWKMTHSSVVPVTFNGEPLYLYCASGGVAAVSAKDGSPRAETPDWKISIANVPAPLTLEDGKIFLCGGYNAGSLMLQMKLDSSTLKLATLFRLPPEVFGSTQQTPILLGREIYGIRPNGQFVCLDFNGKVRWTSPSDSNFGLGSFLLAAGVFYVLNDSGMLSLIEATPEQYHQLAQVRVLQGTESWAPMALVNGRLLARDFTRLACLDVGAATKL